MTGKAKKGGKKKPKKNDLNDRLDFLKDAFSNEEAIYRPVFESLKLEASNLQSTDEKLEFWQAQKVKYLQELNGASLASSGVISEFMPNRELFMDRLISIEIESITRQLAKKEVGQPEKSTPAESLEMLFCHEGNIGLYKKIKAFIVESGAVNAQNLKTGVSLEEAYQVIIVALLNDIIFEVLQAIYLYNNDSLKCVSWTRLHLMRYERPFAEFLKSIIIECLGDSQRFDILTPKLLLIQNEIANDTFLEGSVEYPKTSGMFEYFTGKSSSTDLEGVMKSFLAVRGVLKTQSQIVRDFIGLNREEIVRQLAKESNLLNTIPQTEAQGLHQELATGLAEYGFFELKQVKNLSEEGRTSLIELLVANKLPYKIAMLDYLGFIRHLQMNHFQIVKQRNKILSGILGSDKEGRAVRGQLSTLTTNKADSGNRYTAYQHKEAVKNDYEKLK